VANWDEDAVTLGVEAARNCLVGRDRDAIARVVLASTTAPFADRSNSGIAADALNLGEAIATADAGGSRRAATTELIRSLQLPAPGQSLLIASDCRAARPGSAQEMLYGHGAAAVLLGDGEPIAEYLGSASVHRDLVDQYRASDASFDYSLEERWVREEGWFKIVPVAVAKALEVAGIAAGDVQAFAVAAPTGVAATLATQLGLDKARVVDTLQERVGDCGAAHPLLMLAAALDGAGPGDVILLTGFGQGADAIVLKVTDAIAARTPITDIAKLAQGGRELGHYVRYLVLRGLVDLDYGIRAERDNRTALSTFYRRRDAITGFVGGKCGSCGMLQFPRTAICLGCAERDTQSPTPMAGLPGTVKSYTEDWQAYTPSPPLIYGNVTFPGGANVMMEFTDVEATELQVGRSVRMAFRVKDFDKRRGFRRYFWKPVLQRDGVARG
jgi:3-hydroxy-3-methylglutaryl CoA synthase